jgi:hypothetical protein
MGMLMNLFVQIGAAAAATALAVVCSGCSVTQPRVSVASGTATAPDQPRSCQLYSGNYVQCENGLSGQRYGNTVIWNDGVTSQRYGNTVLNSDGTSSQRYGNMSLYNNGTTTQTYGNASGSMTLSSDGRMCQRFPDGQILCN